MAPAQLATVIDGYLCRPRGVAHWFGLTRKGFSYRLEVARDRLGDIPDYGEPIEGFSSPELPKDEMPTDELIEHMKRRYSTRKSAKDARDPIPIKMKYNDPVGLLMFGDIHVDSPLNATGLN